MPRIVFIHGISQAGKSPGMLRDEWLPGLVAGTSGDFKPTEWETVFPFYGDLMKDYMDKIEEDASIGILTRGAGDTAPLTEVEAIQASILFDLLADARDRGVISDAEIAARTGDPQILEKGVTDWPIVHGLIGALSLVPGLQETAIRALIREVSVYLYSPLARADVLDMVAEHLKPPCVVVGHSLGTVVAYEALRKLGPGAADVPLFTTLGSPLGIKTIRKALEPTKWPPRVSAWFNARDARDVVSMFGLGPDVFNPGKPIEDPGPVQNNGKDSHNITGYLSVPKVGRRILQGAKQLLP
jgi:hypothetical protein